MTDQSKATYPSLREKIAERLARAACPGAPPTEPIAAVAADKRLANDVLYLVINELKECRDCCSDCGGRYRAAVAYLEDQVIS